MGKRGSAAWWQAEIALGGEHTVMYSEAEIFYPHETYSVINQLPQFNTEH